MGIDFKSPRTTGIARHMLRTGKRIMINPVTGKVVIRHRDKVFEITGRSEVEDYDIIAIYCWMGVDRHSFVQTYKLVVRQNEYELIPFEFEIATERITCYYLNRAIDTHAPDLVPPEIYPIYGNWGDGYCNPRSGVACTPSMFDSGYTCLNDYSWYIPTYSDVGEEGSLIEVNDCWEIPGLTPCEKYFKNWCLVRLEWGFGDDTLEGDCYSGDQYNTEANGYIWAIYDPPPVLVESGKEQHRTETDRQTKHDLEMNSVYPFSQPMWDYDIHPEDDFAVGFYVFKETDRDFISSNDIYNTTIYTYGEPSTRTTDGDVITTADTRTQINYNYKLVWKTGGEKSAETIASYNNNTLMRVRHNIHSHTYWTQDQGYYDVIRDDVETLSHDITISGTQADGYSTHINKKFLGYSYMISTITGSGHSDDLSAPDMEISITPQSRVIGIVNINGEGFDKGYRQDFSYVALEGTLNLSASKVNGTGTLSEGDYYFSIAAFNPFQTSAVSSEVLINIGANEDVSSILLEWDKVSEATGYVVFLNDYMVDMIMGGNKESYSYVGAYRIPFYEERPEEPYWGSVITNNIGLITKLTPESIAAMQKLGYA